MGMGIYNYEAKEDLQVGEVCLERDIYEIINIYKKGSIVLCDSVSRFSANSDRMFEVINRVETYMHKNEDYTYQVSDRPNLIYVVEQVR